ncbi:helix-turn-helix transcriptional regulator [Ensifer sp. LC163]|uniref:helix-turn-helix transcriptional regulator n=1 Tax=Ensifer sp. LC163 TaxID=1120652 RepID=UPI000812FB3D|nr:AraC family transcriptional regulator [Ensifer sp. LC163]OCP14942.1 AraC family transcriptional regulator [Ensifer sp. LC163]
MRLPPIDLSRENTFGEISYESGGEYGPIRGDYIAFIIVHLGSLKIEADETTVELEAGQCALSLTHDRYLTTINPDALTHISWCDGRPQNAAWLFKERHKYAPFITASAQVQTLMQLGVDLGIGDRDGRGGLREALTNTLLNAYIYEAEVVAEERPIPQTILQARRFLDENFAADVSIERVAQQVRVSPQYLVSAFKKHLGMTPARYLWRCRLDYGAHLLQRSGLSVSEIAYQVGYKNPYHFSRQIKLAFDCSPTELREKMLNG